ATEEALGERIEFRTGDTRSLDFSDGQFDAVVAHTLISHVEEPLVTLKEAARVLKPGGTITIFDGDYASLTFALSDPEKGKRYDEKLISAVVTRPYIMRQMSRLIRDARLETTRFFAYVMAEMGEADFFLPGIESFEKLGPQSGAVTEEEAVSWVAELKKSSDEGVFFGAGNFLTYIAR
ncbi:MAG: methyltransferase domain-containing protein, partial [Thermomicrobiaceae bacterium]